MQFKAGHVAVITGAGSGIGRCLATQLAQQGCALALADIDETALQETCQQLPEAAGKVTRYTLDVSDKAGYQAFVDQVIADHGKVNAVFNNAGVAHSSRLEQASIEDFEWLMGINFWGVVYGSKLFLPYLRKQDDAHIINISSVFGLISVPYNGVYNASKFAVRGFTEALRQELSMDSLIKVTCVHPGGIQTNIAKKARFVEAPSAASHDDIARQFEKMARTPANKAAKVILDGVQKDKRRVLIGTDARVIDWTQRLLPSFYDRIIVAMHSRAEAAFKR